MSEKNETITKSEEIVITRIFDAPLEQVWKAWTDPERVKLWWGPKRFTSPICKIDFRVGGKYLYLMRSPEGQDFWTTGEYKEIIKNERIVCTNCFADEKGNIVSASTYGMNPDIPMEMMNTIIFEAQGNKTRLILKHTGLPAGEMSKLAKAGWNESLDKFAESLK